MRRKWFHEKSYTAQHLANSFHKHPIISVTEIEMFIIIMLLQKKAIASLFTQITPTIKPMCAHYWINLESNEKKSAKHK